VLTGDHVVVLNATKVMTTGRKALQKIYYRHSGYVGSLRAFTLKNMMELHPERVIELAVKGMLPRNKRGRQMLRRLKVYAGDSHPHQAQIRPETESSQEKG
jgi:large subunit ribosomal protein L13